MRTALVIALLASTAAFAQTNTSPRTTGHDRGNMEHREGTAKNDTVPAQTTAREASRPVHQGVYDDATRIAGLLRDVQYDVPVSTAMWRTIANEANTLANRIHGRTSRNAAARKEAAGVRAHVREMRTAALRGDAAAARMHAGQALPFAYRLIEWAD